MRKLYYVFNAGFTALPQSYPFYVHEEHTLLRYLVVGPWLLIPLGLLGLILAGIRRPNRHAGAAAVAGPPARAKTSARPSTGAQRTGYRVWLAFAPGYAISVAVFFVAERYRLPLLVALTVGAGAGADLLIQTIRARERRRLITAVAMLAVAAAGANWPLHLNDSQWIEGLRLAQRLSILGRETEALQVIPRIERLEPSPGATDYGVAEQLLDLKQPQEALPLLTQAQAKSPADPRFDFALGQALRQLGRPREALPHLRHGFEAGIELPQGGYDYAAALGEAGDDAGALAALKRINPGDDADGWLRLGRLAVEIHAPAVAEPLFRRAVALRPDAASHQQLGLDLLLLERYEDASRELSDASRLDRRDAGTLSHLAYCDAKLGRLDAARTHAAQALAIDPNDPLARQLAAALR